MVLHVCFDFEHYLHFRLSLFTARQHSLQDL